MRYFGHDKILPWVNIKIEILYYMLQKLFLFRIFIVVSDHLT